MTRFVTLTLLLIAPLGLVYPAMAQSNRSHEHHAEKTELTLNKGKKWQTDAPLREGMANIKQEFAKHLSDIQANKVSDVIYLQLADASNSEINKIFQNCKLPKDADAQLHTVLVGMLAGVGQMKSGQDNGAKHEGALQVVKGLEQYAAHFDHPDWQKLTKSSSSRP